MKQQQQQDRDTVNWKLHVEMEYFLVYNMNVGFALSNPEVIVETQNKMV